MTSMALAHCLWRDITALPLSNLNSVLEVMHTSCMAACWHNLIYADAGIMVYTYGIGHQYMDSTCVQKSAQRAVMVWSCCLPSQYLP